MKRNPMKCNILFFLLLPLFAFAGKDGDPVEKKITRQFAIQPNGYLTIENKYGNLDIAIGESNSIKFDITIRVNTGSEKKANEMIDRVSIDFNEGNNRIEAKTEISETPSWLSWFNSCSEGMEINYEVLVPRDIYLQLTNKYGSIYLENSDRDAKIDLSYGDIRVGDLNANLSLNMAYSDGSLSQIKQGQMNLSFSELAMENSQSVVVDMKYTELTMGSSNRLNVVSTNSELTGADVEEVTYDGKYDEIQLGRVKSIHAQSSFTGIAVQEIASIGNFDMRYGDLTVDLIRSGFKQINIQTSYTGVELGMAENASYTIDAQTTYCDIDYDEDLKESEFIERESSTSLKGNKGSGGGLIKAVMTYGELSIH